MWLPYWFRTPNPGSPLWRARRRRRAAHPCPSTCQLSVEVLEDRWLPSTFTVINTTDHDPGSLRAAVDAANLDPNPDPDVIVFGGSLASQASTITLTSGELLITDLHLSIMGQSAIPLPVSGNNSSRVFEIQAVTTISGLTITGGIGRANNPSGATGFDGIGGGILNFGTLTVRDSTLSGNSSVIHDFDGF